MDYLHEREFWTELRAFQKLDAEPQKSDIKFQKASVEAAKNFIDRYNPVISLDNLFTYLLDKHIRIKYSAAKEALEEKLRELGVRPAL